MSIANQKHFRIQDLPQMLSSDLDPQDLFLMTDIDNKNGKSSKSLNFGNLVSAIDMRLSKNIVDKLQKPISQSVYQQVVSNVDEQISSSMKNIMEDHITEYVPIQKWYDSGESCDIDGIVIECGNSGSNLDPEDRPDKNDD